MSDLPLATSDGEILYLPQGAVARARFIQRLARRNPLATDLITIIGGTEAEIGAGNGVAYTTTWGEFLASNTEAAQAAAQAVLETATGDIATLQQQVAQLMYVKPAISAFAASPAVAEVGASVAAVTLTVTRSRMDLPVAISGASTAIIPAGQSSITVTGPFTAASTWTATVSDAASGDSASVSTSLAFRQKRYWGASAAASLDSAGILALGGSEFATGFAGKAVTYDCSGGRYPYYAYPAAWGTPSAVTVAGLGFSAFTATDVAFTNAAGATETYRVLRFSTLQNGSAIQVVWN